MTNEIIGNVLNYYCIFLINAQKKKETWGKADPHVIKSSWANQEKWKRLEIIRLW